MRYHQLIENSIYYEDMIDDIVNLLTISSTKGYTKIKTSALVKDLKRMGYDVDEKTIHLALDKIDSVVSSNPNYIEISTDVPDEEDQLDDFSGLDVDTNTAFDDISDEEEPDEIDAAAQRQATADLKDKL